MTVIDSSLLTQLQEKIQYNFADIHLLRLALTHKSFGKPNNERLEFLGDAILNALIAEMLYLQNEDTPEGKMTTARAELVKGETLTAVGRQLGMDALMLLGRGERKSGGQIKPSILEDAVEAMIGAVYIDAGAAGFEQSRRVVRALFESRFGNLSDGELTKDAKTTLQELMQASRRDLPVYSLLSTEGPAHQRVFIVGCRTPVTDLQTLGEASTRRAAEQIAAAEMLEHLQSRSDQR